MKGRRSHWSCLMIASSSEKPACVVVSMDVPWLRSVILRPDHPKRPRIPTEPKADAISNIAHQSHDNTATMAPRKRVKVSPSPTSQSSPVAASPSQAEEQLLNDPWTDEEEVGLFKGLIKYKPTGAPSRSSIMRPR